MSKLLNIRGEIIDVNNPIVMGILNVTPDSFYSESRCISDKKIHQRIEQVISEGATIIDIGGYSSRPNADNISLEEEKDRLKSVLSIVDKEYRNHIFISIDTFRADIAKWAVEVYGVDIINDISGGNLDKDMFGIVSSLNIPYILMHMRGTPNTMMEHTKYDKGIILDILEYFIKKIGQLTDLGLHDVILDPGFGFSKTLEQNYELMANLEYFNQILDKPILVGISRKSMIYKFNNTSPAESLNGTSILNTYSLLKGANILRVHDVKEAVELCRMYKLLKSKEAPELSEHINICNTNNI